MIKFRWLLAASILTLSFVIAPALEKTSRLPYLGAIVIEAETGRVLFEDNADAPGYPASITKLMTFSVVMERIESGQLTLETPITVSAEAARTGGSQIYLKQGEVFTVDELLYALMIQSANDAAVALAAQAAGSRDAFVELMNAKARALGMAHTTFHSPHGLPPGKGQQPDVTTARDLALLSRELIQRGQILRYTSVRERTIREKTAQPFIMRNHNGLLGVLPGCDGLKTGYFSAAGFSLAATAQRKGHRIIAVVLGSEQRVARDVKAKELLERGFAALPASLPVEKNSMATAPSAPGQPQKMPTVKTDKASPAPAQQAPPASESMFTFRVIPPEK